MARKTHLQESLHKTIKTLSGGTKRRLCVALAFIGNPDLVILDEPTASVDPIGRHTIRELVQRSKANRAVLICSHYLDEAEMLGDRIAILNRGELMSIGNPLTLKRNHDLGYELQISFSEEKFDIENITDFITDSIKGSYLKRTSGRLVTYHLPNDQSGMFCHVFQVLEEGRFKIKEFNISMAHLDELFMKESKGNSIFSGSEVHLPANRQIFTDNLLNKTRTSQLGALLEKRYLFAKSKWTGKLIGTISSLIVVLMGFIIIALNVHPLNPYLEMSGNMFSRINDNSFIVELSIVPLSESTFREGYNVSTKVGDLLDAHDTGLVTKLVPYNDTISLSHYLLDTNFNHTGSRYISYVNSPLDLESIFNPPWEIFELFERVDFRYSVSILHNTSCFHSLPTGSAELTTSLLKYMTDDSTYIYKVGSKSLDGDFTIDLVSTFYMSLLAVFFVSIPMSYFPGIYASFPTQERVLKATHIQYMSGASAVLYWLANWLWDSLDFCVLGVSIIAMESAFYSTVAASSPIFTALHDKATVILIFTYGLAIIPCTYMLSFFSLNRFTVHVTMSSFHFFTGFVLLVISIMFGNIDPLKPVNDIILAYYRIFPPFNFGNGLFVICTTFIGAYSEGKSINLLDNIQINLLYLYYEAAFSVLLILCFEYIPLWYRSLSVSRFRNRRIDFSKIFPDRIHLYSIVVVNIRKVFFNLKSPSKSHIAVNDLTFGIKNQECFGLLGTNGAGKSTTMGIITGSVVQTKGEVFVSGKNLHSNRHLNLIGYCPQYDPINPGLTGREHLRIFSILKGIPRVFIRTVVEEILIGVSLLEWADKPAGKYSGGNKRKLSLGIALIGFPPGICLDEPSEGIDVIAKRHLWKVILSIKNSAGILLTSHSMEECEILCDRIGIITDGNLICTGSLTELKQKYATKMEIKLKVKLKEKHAIKQFLQNSFENCILTQSMGSHMKMTVDGDNRLSHVFSILEENKQQLGILFYSVEQGTLEQVFIEALSKSAH